MKRARRLLVPGVLFWLEDRRWFYVDVDGRHWPITERQAVKLGARVPPKDERS